MVTDLRSVDVEGSGQPHLVTGICYGAGRQQLGLSLASIPLQNFNALHRFQEEHDVSHFRSQGFQERQRLLFTIHL